MDPFSQELRLREAGVQRDDVYRNIGVSGTTDTGQRHSWHRLDGRLSRGGTLQRIIALRALGVKTRSLNDLGGQTRQRPVLVHLTGQNQELLPLPSLWYCNWRPTRPDSEKPVKRPTVGQFCSVWSAAKTLTDLARASDFGLTTAYSGRWLVLQRRI